MLVFYVNFKRAVIILTDSTEPDLNKIQFIFVRLKTVDYFALKNKLLRFSLKTSYTVERKVF